MATTTNYIWDDETLLAEADSTNTINTIYTSEQARYDDLVSAKISSATSYHHFDATGSTRQLTNSAAKGTDGIIYDAWGNAINRTGATATPFLWIGMLGYYHDFETGKFHVRERTYDPTTGRWTAEDPFAQFSSTSLFETYIYVSSRPILHADPSGLADGALPSCKRADCQNCADKAMKDDKIIQELVKWLKAKPPYNKIKGKKACPVPKPICCGDKLPPENEKRPECDYCTGLGAGPSRKGRFYPAKDKTEAMIVLCAAFIGDPTGQGKGWDTCTAVVETLRHEFWHAAAACGPWLQKPEDNCDACLCDELFAYATSGQCMPGSVWFKYAGAKLGFNTSRECAIKSAAASCNSQCAGDVEQRARDLVDQCLFGGGLLANIPVTGEPAE
jgi:RHS repeat-associated protein